MDLELTNQEEQRTAQEEQTASQEQSASSILRAEGLVKRYGKRTVVNDVNINVRQGEIVGLLGPNGAGKTTSFYMTHDYRLDCTQCRTYIHR